jgi:F-type H+-transporting ATPase subunit delta
MVNLKAARRYSTALFSLADSMGLVDIIKNDFEDIKKSLQNSRELRLFIESPIINPEKKLSVVKELFKDRVNDLTVIASF